MMVRMSGALLLLALFACSDRTPLQASSSANVVGWPSYAGDAGSQRWSPLSDITAETVPTLRRAWTWAANEIPLQDSLTGVNVRPDKFEATPLVIRDTMYVVTPYNRAMALDAATGRELWVFDPRATERGPISNDHAGFVHRGLSAWEGPEGLRIILASRTELYSLDARTGVADTTFGERGVVDLAAHLRWPVNRQHVSQTSPPAIWNDIIIVGSAVGDGIIHERDPPGDVQAFDARTGELLWRWDPVPAAGDSARATWGGRSAEVTGHLNVWAPISVDTVRGLVYLPVSTPSNDWYGGARLGDNLFAESIVCLDGRTGKMRWYHQIVHHGLWDYDLAAAPVLTTVKRGELEQDVVLIAAKTGYVYGFDRVTGEPIWPIEERSVPGSDVPGEAVAPTQPHVQWPQPFARQGFNAGDVSNLSPELQSAALERIKGLRLGPMFTPPSLVGTVVAPGWIGGAGWGATAVDPLRQLLFVKSSNAPVIAKLVATNDDRRFIIDSTRTPDAASQLTLPAYRTWYGARRSGSAVPLGRPPFGLLTAYDVVSGALKWQVTIGDMPAVRRHPWLRERVREPLGVVGAPGPIATAGGLLFLTGGGSTLYAIESVSGRTMWSVELGQVGYSNPATYRTADGRQFVVIATGNGAGSTLQAFALPHKSIP